MSAPTTSAPPASFWSRSSKLLSLAAGLASKELQGRVERAISRGEEVAQQLQRARVQIEQARDIAQSLGQLKGAAMKAGQLLSMELRDLLPPEASEILQTLQDQAPAVEWGEIHAILREELGAEALAQLQIDERPLASASIGQVHRATWQRPGQGGPPLQLVLKVQFRGIAETIDSDLLLLERIARLFVAAQFKELDLSAVFEELRAVLVRETDYRIEADSLERYRAFAHQVPGLRVPEVYRALSTARVLALSFEPGLKLGGFLQTGPSEEARAQLGAQLLDLYFREFFEWGLVQTDANFANFLFRPGVPGAASELVLLDFGATRDYDAVFRERYRALLLAAFRSDFPATLAYAQDLGLIDPGEGPGSQRNLYELLRAVLSVFGDAAQPVDFRDRKLVDDAGAKLRKYYQGLTRAAPPAQLIFLHRKLGGVYSLGKALGVRLDLRPFWRRLEQGPAAPPASHGVLLPRQTSAEQREGGVVGPADAAGLVPVAQ
jgi:aarF domain-containing kinase